MQTNQIVKEINNILEKNITENVGFFRKDDSFKVRPGYGYDKFYLDRIDGSYDMSLQGLIHHIMYEEGFYKKILNDKEYAEMEVVIAEYPESIYGPTDEDENYEDLQEKLDSIYWESITFVGKKLLGLGFDVEETFSEYFECLADDEIEACKDSDKVKGKFDVVLTAVGEKKINVLRAVCDITGLGLKEAKDLIVNMPYIVKEAVSKKEADGYKAQLEEAGASVDLLRQ